MIYTVKFFHVLLSCVCAVFSLLSSRYLFQRPVDLNNPPAWICSCQFLCTNPTLLSMLNCKYVHLLYLCFDAVINPLGVGVIMNGLPAMERVGIWWLLTSLNLINRSIPFVQFCVLGVQSVSGHMQFHHSDHRYGFYKKSVLWRIYTETGCICIFNTCMSRCVCVQKLFNIKQ